MHKSLDSNVESKRFQFNLRTSIVFTAIIAIITAVAVTSGYFSGLSFMFLAFLSPGILGTIAYNGGPYDKVFCLSAMVPILFGLYSLGWAFGWTVFNSTSPTQLLGWFETRHHIIKAVTLSSWVAALLCGLICLLVRWHFVASKR